MASWPSYARILFDDFGQRRGSALERTDFEHQIPKQVKRYSRVMVERPCRVRLDSNTDFDNFMTWFNTTIKRGADWFDWTDPRTGTTRQARIKNGLIEEEKPQNRALTRWALKLTLETWDG